MSEDCRSAHRTYFGQRGQARPSASRCRLSCIYAQGCGPPAHSRFFINSTSKAISLTIACGGKGGGELGGGQQQWAAVDLRGKWLHCLPDKLQETCSAAQRKVLGKKSDHIKNGGKKETVQDGKGRACYLLTRNTAELHVPVLSIKN